MRDAGLHVDHVVLGVADLDAASASLDAGYGLTSVGGGRHPGWGTANRLVPLGDTYLELVTVVEADEAAASAFGRWVLAMLAGGPRLGWAVRTDDLAVTASRLGLEVAAGSRRSRDGTVLRWKIAGVAQAAADPALPFFLQWGPGTALPGRLEVEHRAGPVALSRLLVEGDAERLAAWVGTRSLPVDVVPGRRGLTGVTLATRTGAVVLGGGALGPVAG